MAVEIVAGHRLQVGQPPDGRMTVGVSAKRHRRHLLIEELVGIVLAALQLGDDDRALGLAIFELVKPVRHALGFDEQQLIERVAPGRLEVGRLVNPRVAVPHSPEALDEAFHLVARDVSRALEVHVFDPVGHAGEARRLVAGTDAIPAPDRHERSSVNWTDQNLQSIVQARLPDGEHRSGRDRRNTHGVHYTGRFF